MSYMITNHLNAIDLFAEGTDEILQNIIMIQLVRQGTVPLFREFGSTHKAIDKLMPIAETIHRAELIEQVEKYEPRATIASMNFERDELNAVLKIRTEVEI